jgi:hypothetical protein
MPKPVIVRSAAMILITVVVLEFEFDEGVVVDSAVGSDVGFASSMTKTAVVRLGILKVPFS